MLAHKKLWECGIYNHKDPYWSWTDMNVTNEDEFVLMVNLLAKHPTLFNTRGAENSVHRMYACFFALFFADEMERAGEQQGIVVGHNFNAWIEV